MIYDMAISNIYVTAKISMTSVITRVFWIEIQLFISSIWNYILVLSGFPQCPKKVLSCPIILMHMHFCVCACKYVWEKQYVMVLERKCLSYIYISYLLICQGLNVTFAQLWNGYITSLLQLMTMQLIENQD